jgi:4-diphosphocytidyl-2-C-methyl-D-erythritol kinase
MTAGVVTVPAHAKLNLDLRVLGVRDDGYHELATVFQTVALHDTLTVRPAAGPMRLTCSEPGVPADERNLAWRAVQAAWTAAGREGGAAGLRVHLDKRIPMQAGLGGGSADAAAALVAANAVLDLGLSPSTLRDVAAGLGADVAFFLVGGTAEGRGRGDLLRTLPDVPSQLVLVAMPPFGVSTAEAYRWYDDQGAAGTAPGAWPGDSLGWHEAFARCRNDLEPTVAARHPEIGALVSALRPASRLAAMSGSGSAVFAVFDRRDDLTAAAGMAVARGWRAIETETLGREAYQRALRGGLGAR